jgi:hypothetical protein
VRYAFIADNRLIFAVRAMCRSLWPLRQHRLGHRPACYHRRLLRLCHRQSRRHWHDPICRPRIWLLRHHLQRRPAGLDRDRLLNPARDCRRPRQPHRPPRHPCGSRRLRHLPRLPRRLLRQRRDAGGRWGEYFDRDEGGRGDLSGLMGGEVLVTPARPFGGTWNLCRDKCVPARYV